MFGFPDNPLDQLHTRHRVPRNPSQGPVPLPCRIPALHSNTFDRPAPFSCFQEARTVLPGRVASKSRPAPGDNPTRGRSRCPCDGSLFTTGIGAVVVATPPWPSSFHVTSVTWKDSRWHGKTPGWIERRPPRPNPASCVRKPKRRVGLATGTEEICRRFSTFVVFLSFSFLPSAPPRTSRPSFPPFSPLERVFVASGGSVRGWESVCRLLSLWRVLVWQSVCYCTRIRGLREERGKDDGRQGALGASTGVCTVAVCRLGEHGNDK